MKVKLTDLEIKSIYNLIERYGDADNKVSLRRGIEGLIDRINIRKRREILNTIENLDYEKEDSEPNQ